MPITESDRLHPARNGEILQASDKKTSGVKLRTKRKQQRTDPSKPADMYVPNHLKWRILLAQELKEFYFERENSHRNCKRIYELYGRYLLGTTYDTFLNYLNQLKYEITNLRLPSYIVAAIGLLEPLRIANERLRLRKINTSWTLLEMVEETLAILQERANTPLNLRITSRNRPE